MYILTPNSHNLKEFMDYFSLLNLGGIVERLMGLIKIMEKRSERKRKLGLFLELLP